MNAIVVHNHHSMDDTERMALAIARGGLFGSKDPNAVLTLCLLAQAEGKHPALVMQDYHIINGKPAKKAEAMLRDFLSSGGKVEWHALSDDIADATFSHPSGGTLRIDWTRARAKAAQLTTAMWNKYPRQMLRSRLISEGVRSVCPSATSGMYEEGEVRDMTSERREATDGGDVRDISKERAVGSDLPADTLRDQLEQSVHVSNEPQADQYAFPEGPATGITQLKRMARELWREIEGCGDDSELSCLLAVEENKALMKQLAGLENPAHREIWLGDGKDNPGVSGLIIRKETEFAQAVANHMTDLAHT